MKIRIEADTDSIIGTKVFVDDVDWGKHINQVVFVQRAGELPSIGLMRTSLDKDGRPYIDAKTGDLVRDVVAYSSTHK